ncbi:baseplate J/gp47 family protein [Methylobacterium sp. WL120]|uniref:baseplate assembly protein n=1 Tax=Methylobacterium sp. WL120 TaxID=2603887 RepID=UPI0011CA041B|nr:baseplate J/gp47 family protein [Methylobacterium sp. WL120]TXM68202.1 baseplate assembly protein [Methylobacterium sp. WL120]
MPYYENPSLYIDFSRLAPPQVVEEIDYEKLVTIYQNQVVLKQPLLKRAVRLEQSPTNVILEAEAYGEMIVRARINAAARAVMLPFAKGTDLDNLAAFYNVYRDTIPADPVTGRLAAPEDDTRFRRRVQLAPEAFSTAGSAGAYIFHALTADPTIRDVSVKKINDRAGIKVSVMNSGNDPKPTDAQLLAVTKKLFSPAIKPLTDVVSVAPVGVHYVTLDATVNLYPGPDSSLVSADITKALQALRNRIALTGRDLTYSALYSALNQEGVQEVKINSPNGTIEAADDECVWIQSANVQISSIRRE